MIAQTVSNALFLGLVGGLPLYGAIRKIRVYDVFVDGARGGFEIAIKIIPYLVAMIVAINLMRASGLMKALASLLSPLLNFLHIPAEIVPMALIRPFSGSAATGAMADIIQHNGGDAYVSKVAAVLMGSTETTFYVIAVYFGAVGIMRVRHAVITGLIADLAGILAACYVAYLFFA